jgi:hypothetical protein
LTSEAAARPVLESTVKAPPIAVSSVAARPASLSAIVASPIVPVAAPIVESPVVGSQTFEVPETIELPPEIEDPEEKNREDAEPRLEISGTKTFEMKKADVKGDIGHFSTENFDSIPGFHLDQSLHLEIEGQISRSTKVSAVLDDKDDEDRRFTVHVDGSVWKWIIGDFPLSIKETEYTLFNKEVRGVLLQGQPTERLQTTFLYSSSKGAARREQFRGAGQQQEFRLGGAPIVQNSERVAIDGRLLTRGTDYLIDYEDGVLKFQPQLLPLEVTRWIVVEYEVSDKKLAFKRNLMGSRVNYLFPGRGRLAVTMLREADDTTPKADVTASATVRPMEHRILGFDGEMKINQILTLSGEHSYSLYDPNLKSNATAQDREIADSARRLTLQAKSQRIEGEISQRQVGRDFKLIGREGGVTELGERGLVSDILKETGRVTYALRPTLSLFGGLENSRTNRSGNPAFSSIDFSWKKVGATWKYRGKSQLETRFEDQVDRETQGKVLSNQDKTIGALVWDHEFGRFFSQSKIERTVYGDAVNAASGSNVLQTTFQLGSDKNKKFAWNLTAGKVALDDDLDKKQLRSEVQNYMVDMNFDPNRVFNARGIFQWRREKDFFVNMTQRDEIADSRIQYRPNPDVRTQLKYKVENTTKVIRDPSIDPTKFVRPPSLPLDAKDREEVVGRFENPVQKRTTNFTTSYRLGEKGETNIDWKLRDLKDRNTGQIVSFNDRKTYDVKYVPRKKWRLTGEYERGLSRNLAPKTELQDEVKRIGVSNEFREGNMLDSKYEIHDENDVYQNENDKKTYSTALDYQRIFSKAATIEMGVQRNDIRYRQPSKELEKRAALVFTPQARNQRYRFFVTHKDISAEKSGTQFEGGVNFSQIIGTDSLLDGEIKRVRSSAGIYGTGYEGTVANAKMVITF